MPAFRIGKGPRASHACAKLSVSPTAFSSETSEVSVPSKCLALLGLEDYISWNISLCRELKSESLFPSFIFLPFFPLRIIGLKLRGINC